MSYNDNKELYAKASKYYVEKKRNIDETEYEKSKRREIKHNKDWQKVQVNLNDIIDKFAKIFEAKEHNCKLIFYGEKYNVIADMVSGYVRIYDKSLRTYVDLDGNPGNDRKTHFKIKKREEM